MSWGEAGGSDVLLSFQRARRRVCHGRQEPHPLLPPQIRAPFLRSHGLGSGLASVRAEEGL